MSTMTYHATIILKSTNMSHHLSMQAAQDYFEAAERARQELIVRLEEEKIEMLALQLLQNVED